MPFPQVERVIYKRNPLSQVICQLRFPPILKIDTTVPAEFQDRIRKEFPNFSETSEIKINLPQRFLDSVPSEMVAQIMNPSGGMNYEFLSEDGLWKFNLTRTFIALTSKKYTRWEEFKDKLREPLDAFVDIYSPSSFSRIGLRYINLIERSALQLGGVGWSELLQPHILGVMNSPELSKYIENFVGNYDIALSDEESEVRLVTRLVRSKVGGEENFIIDSDFHTIKKTSGSIANNKLDFFHERGSRLIRWCITDRLHQAMEPETI